MELSKHTHGRAGAALVGVAVAVALATSPALAAPGVPSNGKISFAAFYGQTNGSSQPDGISDDGRFVTYFTLATNIVAEDSNTRYDLYHYDRLWGVTTLVSAAADGTVGNSDSTATAAWGRKLSSNGRYVMFYSWASNLVPGDTNGQSDVFVRDTALFGGIERISVAPGRNQINNTSFAIGLSADGRKCLFSTPASLVAADTNGTWDIYMYDRTTQTTSLVSKRADGTAFGGEYGGYSADGAYLVFATNTSLLPADTNGSRDIYRLNLSSSQLYLVSSTSTGVAVGGSTSQWAPVSADASRVVFETDSPAVASDTNGTYDVYVKNTVTGQTVRASLSATNTQSTGRCWGSDISANGRYVAFECDNGDMVTGDTNGESDVFVKDLQTGSLTLVSRVQNGAFGNRASHSIRMTSDASQLVFSSMSSNLTPGDTNAAADVFATTRQ